MGRTVRRELGGGADARWWSSWLLAQSPVTLKLQSGCATTATKRQSSFAPSFHLAVHARKTEPEQTGPKGRARVAHAGPERAEIAFAGVVWEGASTSQILGASGSRGPWCCRWNCALLWICQFSMGMARSHVRCSLEA
jgi:hypothetical protein